MKHLLSIQATVFATLLSLSALPALAQAPQGEGESTVVRVKGLDPAIRDAVVAELALSQDLRLSYACVPAGILVFEQNSRSNAIGLRTRTMEVVEKHARSKDITVLPISLVEAEQQCAQARNR
jgi:siroheme synthase